jgi:hypothetical protein
MTALAGFDVAAAQDALARSDDGQPALPGDAQLIAVLDRHCQWGDLWLDDQRRADEYADWLARQCPVCEEGGGGPECDDCVIAEDAAAKRREDY